MGLPFTNPHNGYQLSNQDPKTTRFDMAFKYQRKSIRKTIEQVEARSRDPSEFLLVLGFWSIEFFMIFKCYLQRVNPAQY